MRRFLLISALLPLAACNAGGPTVSATNASTDEVAAKVAAASSAGSFLSPGRWEGTMTISDMSMPGMTPRMQEAMKASLGKPEKVTSCLTPEDVKKPDFFGKDKDCRYDRFVMSGGTIDAVATCAADGTTHTMSIKGSYSADSYNIVVEANGDAAKPMHMKMTTDARRTGACRGTEDKE